MFHFQKSSDLDVPASLRFGRVHAGDDISPLLTRIPPAAPLAKDTQKLGTRKGSSREVNRNEDASIVQRDVAWIPSLSGSSQDC